MYNYHDIINMKVSYEKDNNYYDYINNTNY